MDASDLIEPTQDELALQAMAELDQEARDDLAWFSEHVFDVENNWHHDEWYDLLQGERAKRLMLMAPRGHAKSTVFSVIWPLWMIGNNPDVRIVIVSNAQGTAELFLREITAVIERNDDYRRVFSNLKPANPEKWMASEILVNRESTAKDATVVATSVGGQLLAKRADIIICDDILTLENTRTAMRREFVKEWFLSVLLPVLEPTGRLVVCGTPWNLLDLYQQLMKDPTYLVRKRYDAILDEEKKTVMWPARWSWKELMDEKESMGIVAFNRSYRTLVTNPDEAVFKEEWLDAAKERGKNLSLIRAYDPAMWTLGPTVRATGTDLAISKAADADDTAFAAVAEMQSPLDTTDNDGAPVRSTGMKIPMWLEAGHFSPAQTRARLIEMHENFNPEVMMVENNAYQEAMRRDVAEQTSLPIKGYTTGGEKFDPEIGINSLAVDFENGKWILPYGDEYSRKMTDRLITAMLTFPQGHTDDVLMALWFGNTGLRDLSSGKATGSVRAVKHSLYRKRGVG